MPWPLHPCLYVGVSGLVVVGCDARDVHLVRHSKVVNGLHSSGFFLHEKARVVRTRSGGLDIADSAKRARQAEKEGAGEDGSDYAMLNAIRHKSVCKCTVWGAGSSTDACPN
jgi:hypothetical protein